jgi:hypothetical protein
MATTRQVSSNGARAPRTDHEPESVAQGDAPAHPSASAARPSLSSSESRLNDRLARLLNEKSTPDAVLLGVLSVALLLGLIGLAVHVVWVVAIVVMALGLGFTVANSRRDRIDVLNQRAEDRSLPTSIEDDQIEIGSEPTKINYRARVRRPTSPPTS